jgi:hypothetical protein
MSEFSGELIVPLDYEQTISALRALGGTRVSVSVVDADTGYLGATFRGPLRSKVVRDLAEHPPELEGDFSGETVYFAVADPDQSTVVAGFAIWLEGFEWGQHVPPLDTVAFRVAGLSIHVRTEASL